MLKRYQRCLVLLIGFALSLSSLVLAVPAHAATRSSYASYDQITDQHTDATPAIGYGSDKATLYMAWNGTRDSAINVMKYDGFSWSVPYKLKTFAGATGVSMALYPTSGNASHIYIAYADGNHYVHIGWYQEGASTLQNDVTITSAMTDYAPSVVGVNDSQLAVAWVDQQSGKIMLTFSNDQTNGNNFQQNFILQQQAKAKPALTMHNRVLYITYVGTDSNIHVVSYGPVNPSVIGNTVNYAGGLPIGRTNGDVATTATPQGLVVAWGTAATSGINTLYTRVIPDTNPQSLGLINPVGNGTSNQNATLGGGASAAGPALTYDPAEGQVLIVWPEASDGNHIHHNTI